MSHAQQVINDCVEFIDASQVGKFSWSGLVRSVRLTVEYVEDIEGLGPGDKKDLVIAVAKELIDRDHGPLDQFDDIFKPLIAATIDELIEVGATGLKIRKQDGCASFCSGVGSRCIKHLKPEYMTE
jgi:hypothetical protein